MRSLPFIHKSWWINCFASDNQPKQVFEGDGICIGSQLQRFSEKFDSFYVVKVHETYKAINNQTYLLPRIYKGTTYLW